MILAKLILILPYQYELKYISHKTQLPLKERFRLPGPSEHTQV